MPSLVGNAARCRAPDPLMSSSARESLIASVIEAFASSRPMSYPSTKAPWNCWSQLSRLVMVVGGHVHHGCRVPRRKFVSSCSSAYTNPPHSVQNLARARKVAEFEASSLPSIACPQHRHIESARQEALKALQLRSPFPLVPHMHSRLQPEGC